MKISVRLDEATARQVSELAQLTGQGITVVTRQALAFYHQQLCVDTEPAAPPVAARPKVTDVEQVETSNRGTPGFPWHRASAIRPWMSWKILCVPSTVEAGPRSSIG